MEIQLNARVDASDGAVGEVARVILHAETRQLTYVVVQPREGGDPLMVPIGHVAEADEERVLLDVDAATFRNFESFLEHDVTEVTRPHTIGQTLQVGDYLAVSSAGYQDSQLVPITRERVPEGSIALEPGARVHATDGQVGEVREFLVHPSDGLVSHMVLREGHFWGRKDVHIPVSAIARVDHEDVYLTLDKHSIQSLPTVKVG